MRANLTAPVTSKSSRTPGKKNWWIFLAPVVASGSVTCVEALVYLVNSPDAGPDAGPSLESFLGDREDVGDEEVLEKMKEERRHGAMSRPRNNAERAGK